VYCHIRKDDLAPPCLEDGKIVEAQEIDNKHLFAYIQSAKVPLIYSKLLKMDLESLTQVFRILSLAGMIFIFHLSENHLSDRVCVYWMCVRVRERKRERERERVVCVRA
jgi:hypothetical protein